MADTKIIRAQTVATAGMQWRYVTTTVDRLNITATAPNVFIHRQRRDRRQLSRPQQRAGWLNRIALPGRQVWRCGLHRAGFLTDSTRPAERQSVFSNALK